MQVVQRRQDLEDVAHRHVDGHEAVGLGALALPQRRAADVLHDDEAGVGFRGLDEVDDLHDPRMRDLRQELPLGLHHGEVAFAGGGHHALEHDPAVGDVVVLRQVDPAQATVGDGPGDLVLAGHQVAGRQRGGGLAGRRDLLRAHDRVARVGRRDERQLHHALGDGAALAGAAAAFAERVQGAAVRFRGRVDAGGRGNALRRPAGARLGRDVGFVHAIVVVREGVEGRGDGARLRIVGERVEGHGLGGRGGFVGVRHRSASRYGAEGCWPPGRNAPSQVS